MKPLKIFLTDLTYDTITLSTDVFPLNIGYIASYCKKLFGSDVEITLFKYIDEIDKAVNENPPDILGLSNYCWSHNVSYEIFKMCKKTNPNVVTIWGGPNFPIDFPSQKKFMEKYKEVDIYVPTEGETGFSNVVKKVLESNSIDEVKQQITESPIDGCISRNEQGQIQFTVPTVRISSIDEITSPYLNGMMSKFFDGKLTPMLQSNRGCPFHCTFCTDGSDLVNQVNQFSKSYIANELQYIVEHVPDTVHTLHIADLILECFQEI